MERKEYPGQSIMHLAVLPARVAYLISERSTASLRQAVHAASSRWGEDQPSRSGIYDVLDVLVRLGGTVPSIPSNARAGRECPGGVLAGRQHIRSLMWGESGEDPKRNPAADGRVLQRTAEDRSIMQGGCPVTY